MSKDTKRALRSTGEVAAVVGLTQRAVEKWCEQGLVVCRRTPGGQYRIEVDEQGFPIETETR